MAEALLLFVSSFVRSSGGGQFSFKLLCSVPKCHRQDTISASRHTIGSEGHKRKACEKFVAQGWSIEGSPVCPECRWVGDD